MTTDRPYRRARTVEEALVEMKRCAGTQFDPDVVDALVHVSRR
jgi:HD-GYP domain-containing protein (c-di-GMP phosphodiesterase class II)